MKQYKICIRNTRNGNFDQIGFSSVKNFHKYQLLHEIYMIETKKYYNIFKNLKQLEA